MLEKSMFVILNICLLLAVATCFVAAYECPFLVLKLGFMSCGVLCISGMVMTLHLLEGRR